MLTTHSQAFTPIITAHKNPNNEDLIRVSITEDGGEVSLTMRRAAWQALIGAVEDEMFFRPVGLDWTALPECGE